MCILFIDILIVLTYHLALFTSLVAHSNALKSLQREHKKHLEREKALSEILDNLRRGYNPNYQDMAVLDAVRGWEYHANLPHIGEEEREEGSDEEATPAVEETEQLEEGMWTAEQLDNDLDNLLKTDYESLLMSHDQYAGTAAAESLSKRMPTQYATVLSEFNHLQSMMYLPMSRTL